jgi:CubicO group peptidase (beta-lactamase class C family)
MRAAGGVLVLVVAFAVLLRLAPSPSLTGGAGSALDRYVREADFAGAALVARGDRVLLSQGYGQASTALGTPNTPRTPFRIGSMTKQFTAAAILMLQERGRLRVDGPVCEYLDDCPSAWRPITIHHLLTHASGLVHLDELPGLVPTIGVKRSVPDLLGLFRDAPLRNPPGGPFFYSNAGYDLLGAVVEKVSGQPWGAFLRASVFAPLGMADTAYDPELELLDRTAVGYVRNRAGNVSLVRVNPVAHAYAAGGLQSTVEDLYRWERALATGRVLGDASREAMFTAQTVFGYGYGWQISTPMGRRIATHSGHLNGFSACVTVYPDDDVYLIALSNLGDQPICSMIIAPLANLVWRAD